jgi:hypothetical protein
LTGTALIAGTASLVAVSGCSSSPSAKARAAASASARASALASKFGINPNQTFAPGAHGPAGDITAPTSAPPNPTSPGGYEIFPNVTAAQRNQMGNHLVKIHGVRTVTYYPQFKQLQIYFTASATSADRKRVYRYVTTHDPAAAGTSASPTASPTPTPTTTAS